MVCPVNAVVGYVGTIVVGYIGKLRWARYARTIIVQPTGKLRWMRLSLVAVRIFYKAVALLYISLLAVYLLVVACDLSLSAYASLTVPAMSSRVSTIAAMWPIDPPLDGVLYGIYVWLPIILCKLPQ